jgi:uncharacterized membrane protein
VPFAVLAAAALYLALRWDTIPPAWIVHWDAAGRPNGWARRTSLGVFQLPILGTGVVGLVEGVSAVAWTRRDAAAPVRALGDATAYFSRAMSFGLAVLFAFLAVDLPLGPRLPIAATLVLPLAVLLGAAAFGGARVARAVAEVRRTGHGEAVEGYRRFYYSNSKDRRLWVPKLYGAGWTVNFAHPWAWPVMLLLVGVPIAIALAGGLHVR